MRCPLGGISMPANEALDGLAMTNLSIILPSKQRVLITRMKTTASTESVTRKSRSVGAVLRDKTLPTVIKLLSQKPKQKEEEEETKLRKSLKGLEHGM